MGRSPPVGQARASTLPVGIGRGRAEAAHPPRHNGKPLTVAYSGGTAFNFVNTVENFQTYINSQRKMANLAKDLGATVMMSNHSEFDNAVNKIRMIPGRKQENPAPSSSALMLSAATSRSRMNAPGWRN